MKILLFVGIVIGCFLQLHSSLAHSGRTDSSGGHNCNVGSCAGTYHYHNGGSSTKSTSQTNSEPTVSPTSQDSVETLEKEIEDLEQQLSDEKNAKSELETERDSKIQEITSLQEELIQTKKFLTDKEEELSLAVAETGVQQDSQGENDSSTGSGLGSLFSFLTGAGLVYGVQKLRSRKASA